MNGRERGRKLEQAILAEYERRDEPRRPNSLRPSELGHECERYLWLRYRWADTFERFEGRMLRLFETGHNQEARMVTDLRNIGANVYDKNPNDPKEQISCSIMRGHSKGYLDGVIQDLPFTDEPFVLFEAKSHSDKSFKQLLKDNTFQTSKPQHWIQMMLYMHEHGLKEGLYYAINKNTEEPFCEFVSYCATTAERLKQKAQRVVYSQAIPPKIHQKPEFYQCKWCSAAQTCHHGELPFRTCRTCRFGSPITDQERESHGAPDGPIWLCDKHKCPMGIDDQRRGCDEHRYNPELITGGKHVDEDVYLMDDGSTWTDSGQATDVKAAE